MPMAPNEFLRGNILLDPFMFAAPVPAIQKSSNSAAASLQPTACSGARHMDLRTSNRARRNDECGANVVHTMLVMVVVMMVVVVV